MEWTDTGIVLTARKHGESSLIVSLLTRQHGRHAGLIRRGASRRNRGIYEPGNILSVTWRGRLPEHLGAFTAELVTSHAAALLDSPDELAAVQSAVSLAETSLPERQPHQSVHDGLIVVLEAMSVPDIWPTVYIKWELGLLGELGFGLDLGECAATGATRDLVYVSPKSGRAVSREAGHPYRKSILKLPRFLVDPDADRTASDFVDALHLTGHFLEQCVYADAALPNARVRLSDRMRKRSG